MGSLGHRSRAAFPWLAGSISREPRAKGPSPVIATATPAKVSPVPVAGFISRCQVPEASRTSDPANSGGDTCGQSANPRENRAWRETFLRTSPICRRNRGLCFVPQSGARVYRRHAHIGGCSGAGRAAQCAYSIERAIQQEAVLGRKDRDA